MKKYSLLFLIATIIFVNGVIAQNSIVDSLKKITLNVSNDSAAKLYVKIANIFTSVNSDSVRKYAYIAHTLADNNSVAKGDVLIQIGNSYHMENKVDSALNYYNKALVYFQKIGNDKGIGKVYQSYAIVKRTLADYEGSIQDSKKAYEAFDKINWVIGKVNVLSNISNTYSSLNKNEDAIEYSRKSFALSKMLNDSLKYYTMMYQYGNKLIYVKKPDSAVYYIKLASPFFERNNMYAQLLILNSNLADAFWGIYKNTNLSKEYYYKALKYSYLSGAKDNLKYIYRDLAMCYLFEKKTDSAEFYFTKTLNFIDSTNNQKGLELTKELQTKYETEKKELQIKNQSLEIAVQEKQSKQKSLIILLGSLALIGSGFFGAIAFINYKKTKRANQIIENQKLQVELKNVEIVLQKNIVEEKQKEILDSINYAKRIQRALLASDNLLRNNLPEHFVLYKPKDIVSGDFYWATEIEVKEKEPKQFILATCDCTGHGVPGAFMSLLNISKLNETVNEKKIIQPDLILNQVRSEIIKALNTDETKEKSRDGMDAIICAFDFNSLKLKFAAANNSLVIIRNNRIIEYKADKFPVGLHHGELKPFTLQTVDLQKGDHAYTFTDGFADQFGGDKGKKLMSKNFKTFLLSITHKPMEIQQKELENTLNDWRGNLEQVDDILVIGIRV